MRLIKRLQISRPLLLLLFIGTALLQLEGCARVQIVDHEFCGDMGTQGASCFHTLTTDSRDVPKVQWDDERFGQLCESPDTFADWKAAIEKLCSISDDCDYQTKAALKAFLAKVDKFSARVKTLK